jgi:hypothetical protein
MFQKPRRQVSTLTPLWKPKQEAGDVKEKNSQRTGGATAKQNSASASCATTQLRDSAVGSQKQQLSGSASASTGAQHKKVPSASQNQRRSGCSSAKQRARRAGIVSDGQNPQRSGSAKSEKQKSQHNGSVSENVKVQQAAAAVSKKKKRQLEDELVQEKLTNGIQHEEWSAVLSLLRRYPRAHNQLSYDHLVLACQSERASEPVLCEILRRCQSFTVGQKQHLNCLMARGYWEAVGVMLVKVKEMCKQNKMANSNDARLEYLRYVVDRACTDAQDSDLAGHIIPHCSHSAELLSELTAAAMKRELWHSIGVILKSQGLYSQRLVWQIVTEVAEHASGIDLVEYILPKVSQGKRNHVVMRMAERGQWTYVGKALWWKAVSEQVLHSVITAASAPDNTDKSFIVSLWHPKESGYLCIAATSRFQALV